MDKSGHEMGMRHERSHTRSVSASYERTSKGSKMSHEKHDKRKDDKRWKVKQIGWESYDKSEQKCRC